MTRTQIVLLLVAALVPAAGCDDGGTKSRRVDSGDAGLTAADADGDGISDAVEGTGDADGDGIPAYLDADELSLAGANGGSGAGSSGGGGSGGGGTGGGGAGSCSLQDFLIPAAEPVWTPDEFTQCFEELCGDAESAEEFVACAEKECDGLEDFADCQLDSLNHCHSVGGACEDEFEAVLCCSADRGCSDPDLSLDERTACFEDKCLDVGLDYDDCVLFSSRGEDCRIESNVDCSAKPSRDGNGGSGNRDGGAGQPDAGVAPDAGDAAPPA